MSDALRELIVAIDFDEVDISKLTRVDREMNDIERSLHELGGDIRRMGGQLDRAGTDGVMAMNRIESHTDDVGREMRELSSDADRAMDEIRRSAGRAADAVEEIGDAGDEGGRRGGAGIDNFLGRISEIMPQSRIAGGASALFSNPWVLAGAAVVGAIGGVILKLADLSNETDKAMDRLEALTGSTGQEFETLKESAKDVYKGGFGESLDEAANGVATLHNQFKDLNQTDLTNLTKGAFLLQDLFDADLKDTSKSIKSMTTNFKDLGEQDALDLITFAFQKGGNYADDLLDTLNEYSVYFSKLGIPAEKFVGTLLKGSEAGAFNLDKVGDAVKEFGIRSIDASATTNDAFKSLGFNAKDMGKKMAAGGDEAQDAFMATVAALSFVNDKQEQNRIGVELFGTQWEDLRENVIFAMDGAEKAVDGFKGSTDKAGDALQDNLSTKWTKLKRELSVGLSDLAGGSDGGMFADVLDGLIVSMPAIISGIKDVGHWFGEIFGANGIGMTLDGFGSAWNGLWSTVLGIWNIIGPTLTAEIGGAFSVIWALAGTTLQLIGDAFNVFGKVLQGDWGGAWQAVKDMFNNYMDNIIGIADTALDAVFGVFDSTFGRVLEYLTGIDLTEAGQNIINGLINGMASMKDAAVDKAKEIGNEIWTGVKDFFGIHSPSRLMAETGSFIVEGMEVGISDNAMGAINAAKDVSKGIAAGMGVTTSASGQMTSAEPQISPTTGATPSGKVSGGLSIQMPVSVQIQGNASREDAQAIGQSVSQQVKQELASLFAQLGIQFG